MEDKPHSRPQWRSDFSVLSRWNNGMQCVEGITKEKVKSWRGMTESQLVPKSPTNCYLVGGAFQLWLNPDDSKLEITDVKSWP